MFDAAGEYHPFYDMCGYCQMSTAGQHQPNCPLFQQQIGEGYRLMQKANLELSELFLPIFNEQWERRNIADLP